MDVASRLVRVAVKGDAHQQVYPLGTALVFGPERGTTMCSSPVRLRRARATARPPLARRYDAQGSGCVLDCVPM